METHPWICVQDAVNVPRFDTQSRFIVSIVSKFRAVFQKMFFFFIMYVGTAASQPDPGCELVSAWVQTCRSSISVCVRSYSDTWSRVFSTSPPVHDGISPVMLSRISRYRWRMDRCDDHSFFFFFFKRIFFLQKFIKQFVIGEYHLPDKRRASAVAWIKKLAVNIYANYWSHWHVSEATYRVDICKKKKKHVILHVYDLTHIKRWRGD